LLDSGADVSLLPSQLIGTQELSPAPFPLLAVNNTSLTTDGVISLTVAVKGQKLPATFFVTPNVDEVILGRDWLANNSIVWDFAAHTISVKNQVFRLHVKPGKSNSCKRCITQADVTIAPRSEAILPTYVIYSRLDGLQPSPHQWSTALNAPVNGLRVARTLVVNGSNIAGVRVCNTTERPISMHRGCVVSPLQPVSALTPSQPGREASTNTTPAHIQPVLDRIDPAVPSDVKDRLSQLLVSYSDVFSSSEFDLGCTEIVRHRIDTQGHPPFRQPLRPQPRAQLPVIDQLLDEMQRQGVIEPCNSEWSSNIVLVRKRDGSVRFCVDYRKLNLLTRKDAYPLPRIDRCLDTLSGSVWYSTFDLRSGFHQVAMDPRDVNKTTFICHRGTYRFPKMPFGLCNAPATFQRLMDTVLVGLNYEICLAYLDDIILYSQDLDTHLERLERLLIRLREADLKLKPSKCQLLQKQVHFLGFTVSQQGVGTDPDKVAAVRDWPTPQNLRQSRAFVGLCQYYRRFVPNFSETAAPLYALTKKGAHFQWTSDCQHAFEQLKASLTSAPVLALPDDDGEFILDCDASNHSIGAVLSQIQDGVEKPVCFASQLYNKHEFNYNVTRKELLAVVTFVKKFRQYLLGRSFRVRTDHAALQWLKKTPEPIGQQARWLEVLEEFDYTIEHRPGRLHQNADSLSRVVEGVYAIHTAPTDTSSEPVNWPEVQRNDPDVGFVHELVGSATARPAPETITGRSADVKVLCAQLDQLVVTAGILCRRFYPRGTTEPTLQKVVPHSLRDKIADELHKGLNGGHLGNRRAKAQLQKRFYWPGWATAVRLAKRRCGQCARYQRPRPQHQGALQPMVTGEPWERVSIDVTGPHPTSSKGNVYILTAIDHFTKWVELMPMRNQEATTVAKLLVDRVFCTHGCPLQILTDRGPNFESQLFQEMCRLLTIDKVRTTAYKPSTNGSIERFHATMHSLLARWVATNHRDWDEKLPAVAFAYRTSVHESTGLTPFFMTYGREARIPADLVYGPPPVEDDCAVDFVEAKREVFREAFRVAREQLSQAAVRRKRQYDLRVKPASYKVGDQVWCLIPRRRQGRYQKWASPYQGPFTVIAVLGPVTYKVQRQGRGKPWTIHVDKLKPCHSRGDVPGENPPAPQVAGDGQPAEDPPPQRPRRDIRIPARFRH